MQVEEPIFNVPRVVIGILLTICAVHALRSLLSEDTDVWLVYAAGFIPARFESGGSELPGGEAARFTSWITHMLIHGDVVHLGFNSVWLLVFGGAIAERVGPVRFLLFSLLTGIAGAAAFYAWNPSLLAPVVGASGAISGLMGGTMRFMFTAIDSGGLRSLRENPRAVPLMSVTEALADRRVQWMSLMLVVLNVLAAFGFGTAQDSAVIAWQAHIGGYFAGLLTFGFFDRPRSSENGKQPNGS
ncbi:MAG: rhomboid family intramembrane serine protease [Hyphomicrobium sp.]